MRRTDREITDFDEILEVMGKCDVCRLALNNDGYPYILPLNFGMSVENGQVTLFFHGATEGTKYALMEADNRASFEMDCCHELFFDEEKKSCSMAYESVIGRGRVSILSEPEKTKALKILMEHYREPDFPINPEVTVRTTVFKLTVESMTGKHRVRRHGGKRV